MSAEELAVIIEELILDADRRYAGVVIRIQRKLYDDLVAILKDLELQDGYIRQNTANRKIIVQASNKIQETFSAPPYANAVSNYVSLVGELTTNNVEYFSGLDKAFAPNKLYLRKLQEGVISSVNQYVMRDGLQSQVVKPLEQILVQNVNSGGRFSGFIKQVETFVQGNSEVEGRTLNYTRTFIRDTLMTYSRTYQQAVTADLGLEYYLYSGGIQDTSREFCTERVGKYFSKKEIEAWASLEWKGKKKDTTETSIFLFAGGWNCGHQIIPVSEFIVPEEVKKRNA